MATPSFQIRHTKERIKTLSHEEFMQYKTNCHTVVHVNVIGDSHGTVPFTFNPRIIRKFVCLRELYVSNVRFLHPLFTSPRTITVLQLNNCSQLKSVILNKKMQCITAENCSDLIAIGPHMPFACALSIINCQKFSNLPHKYYDKVDATKIDKTHANAIQPDIYSPNIYLYDTPNARIETLPPTVAILTIKGELTNLPKVFPSVKTELQISDRLFNNIYDIISVSQYYTLYGDICSNNTILSIPTIALMIDHVITHNSIISEISSNTSFAFIIQCIKQNFAYCPFVVDKKKVDFDMVIDILTYIWPKYFVPVKGIKFNPKLSLYESIVLAALPRFYKCLCACKKESPIKFSIFCNKMQDAMRQR